MTTLQQMHQKAQQFADEVEAAILDEKFEIISSDAFSHTIYVCDTRLKIWMTNMPTDTIIYKVVGKYETDDPFPKHRFYKPHDVRNALLAHSTNSTEETAEEHY